MSYIVVCVIVLFYIVSMVEFYIMKKELEWLAAAIMVDEEDTNESFTKS